ncbi:RNA methyltransferase [Candidatus Chloroploca sp. M-50]|uniref:RNA methyltransferase n=1 Tax=Candidatus Chloroploca mongolica TaxID=2528176 RepID=A0ABS4DH36_9CHLR|nr:RNA methyltransferase [Candidatus Chloroploca mongolica]
MIITSPANATIKMIRSLRQRKARVASGLCFVEGIRLVTEAAEAGAELVQLVVAPALLTSAFAHDLVATLRQQGTEVIEVSAEVFASLSAKDGPQGLAAVVRQRWLDLAEVQLDQAPRWIALIEPADPGNLGTIIRTVDGVGASGVIIVEPAADPYDPAALRASMGAAFAVPLVRTSWAELAAWKRATGVTMVGSSDQAATDFRQAAYPTPLVLLMGSERQGLSAEQQALCDLMVAIPMRGRSDSLNLAVAAGILLYELAS